MRTEILLTPSLKETLSIMGEQIKLARLRRNLTMTLVCERAHISRPTLAKVENGAGDVAIGTYARVLKALGGMEEDLLLIAKDDVTGRTFQDLNLKVGKRASKWIRNN